MEVRNERLICEPATFDGLDELLHWRMAILRLDFYTIEHGYSKAFDKLKRRCTSCEFWDACASDLKRDPDNTVWNSYCTNSGALHALTALTEVVGDMRDLR